MRRTPIVWRAGVVSDANSGGGLTYTWWSTEEFLFSCLSAASSIGLNPRILWPLHHSPVLSRLISQTCHSPARPAGPLFAFTVMVLLSGCWGKDLGSSGSSSGSGDIPDASFAAYGSVYRNAHYLEDGTTLLDSVPVEQVHLPITLSGAITQPAQLSFVLSGDAVRGEHYELSLGSESPLQLAEGIIAAAIDVTLDPLSRAGSVWFREKLCSLTLTGGSNVSVEEPDEFRLFIRSVAPVPRIEFQSSAGGGNSNGNPNSLLIVQSEVSGETTAVHYTLSGSAQEGVDYTIAAGSESGVLSIPAGMTSVALDFNVVPSADGSGKAIIVALDHELMDRSDENLWTHTHNWSLVTDDPFYASDPSDHTAWGGGLSSTAPAGTVGLDIITQQAFAPKMAPDGHVLQGLVQSQYMEGGNWYVRRGQENQLYCGGPVGLMPLSTFTCMSVYVETFLPPDDWRDSQFVKMNVRNRTKDINHTVIFRRGASAAEVQLDWQGDSSWGEPIQTPTGFWGLWRHRELQGAVWDRDFGVRTETVNGQVLTRLWHSHVATGEKTFRDASGNQVTEDVGVDLTEPIIRFTYFSDSDGSEILSGGDVANRGKGLLAYWPMLQVSDTPTVGAPGIFWEKRSRFWEPRGNACLDPAAVIVSTFTIQ